MSKSMQEQRIKELETKAALVISQLQAYQMAHKYLIKFETM